MQLRHETYSAGKIGAKVAWFDNEDSDVMGSYLLGKRLGSGLQSSLGGGVE